uniref:Uncharacterized protein n=1 Tax=Rhizophora mucronata TaxID=61149 RepID=A0A2P2KXS3_RHIMU
MLASSNHDAYICSSVRASVVYVVIFLFFSLFSLCLEIMNATESILLLLILMTIFS